MAVATRTASDCHDEGVDELDVASFRQRDVVASHCDLLCLTNALSWWRCRHLPPRRIYHVVLLARGAVFCGLLDLFSFLIIDGFLPLPKSRLISPSFSKTVLTVSQLKPTSLPITGLSVGMKMQITSIHLSSRLPFLALVTSLGVHTPRPQ